MAKYSQNQSYGHTCPWGSADNSPDAFTLAEMKAARRRAPVPAPAAPAAPAPPEKREERKDETTETTTSIRSEKASSTKMQDVEGKMMELLQKCLDKKVIELQGLKRPEVKKVKQVKPHLEVRSSCSTCSTETASRSQRSLAANRPGFDASQVKVAKGKMGAEKKRSVETGYEALDRYPALLREVNGLTEQAITQGLTSTGKQKQAMKLSDASLGKFDADQSRIAYLQMQKSAAEARNKNRSALTFGDEPSIGDSKTSKEVTMAGKRAQAQKLSDASLGKFDVGQSQTAFLETHNTAADMRNKNRVGQGIF